MHYLVVFSALCLVCCGCGEQPNIVVQSANDNYSAVSWQNPESGPPLWSEKLAVPLTDAKTAETVADAEMLAAKCQAQVDGFDAWTRSKVKKTPEEYFDVGAYFPSDEYKKRAQELCAVAEEYGKLWKQAIKHQPSLPDPKTFLRPIDFPILHTQSRSAVKSETLAQTPK